MAILEASGGTWAVDEGLHIGPLRPADGRAEGTRSECRLQGTHFGLVWVGSCKRLRSCVGTSGDALGVGLSDPESGGHRLRLSLIRRLETSELATRRRPSGDRPESCLS